MEIECGPKLCCIDASVWIILGRLFGPIIITEIIDPSLIKSFRITVSAEYTGTRYDDLQNQNQLGDYFLLNTRLDLQLSPNFIFFMGGYNLLNTSYDIYRGFVAPGVTGQAGLKIMM